MSLSGPAGITALVFLGATLLGAIAGPPLGVSRTSSSSPVAAPIDTALDTAPGDRHVRRRLTVSDSDRPAVARLDPALLRALRQAAAAAARDGVEISITSGWRSPAYQERLLRQAISTYGSPGNAARWVATADTSAHVSGRAVDVGPSRATAWLSRHGAAYRLCQIYRNEPWHFDLRPRAADDGCPPMYADPRHDPRMQP
jgi:LAS superfamily LD-carboxypeptidase LdcB